MKNGLFFLVLSLYFFLSLILFIGFFLYQRETIVQNIAFPSPIFSPFSIPKLTLESIFSSKHSWFNQLSQDKIFTLITTGDVLPARTVNYKMTAYHNFNYPFEKTAEFLKAADLTLINLEAPLVKNCPLTNEGMVFCGNQRFSEGLKFAGIDVANLANNHILNWGIEGVDQTINLLKENGIDVCGFPINQMAIKEIKQIKIGFLGWNLLDEFDEEEIINLVKKAKSQVDLLIIFLHWGTEYTSYPADWQVELAHKIIDRGADMIVGNHPHWTQPIEIYQDKLIIYSHGNFVADQEWSWETKTGIVAKHTFYEKKLIDIQIFPILISDYSQPEFLQDKRKEEVLEKLKEISNKQNQLTKASWFVKN